MSSSEAISIARRQWTPLFVATAGVCLGFLFAREQWIYGLALVALVLLFLWPIEVTLGAYAFLLPFDSISRLGNSPEGRAFTWYVGAGIALVLLSLGITNNKLRTPPRSSRYWLAFLGWGALSVFWALDSDRVLAELPTALGLLGLYFVAVCFEVTEEQLSRVAFLAVAGGLVASLMSIGSFQQGFGTIDERSSLIAGTQQADPNIFAASLLIPLALSIAGVVAGRKLAERLMMLVTAFIITFAILLTMSRGALVALVFIAAIYAYRLRLNRWIVTLFWILPLSLLALPSTFFERLHRMFFDRGAGRLDIWVVGMTALKHFVLQGAGLGNFNTAYEQYVGFAPVYRGHSRAAHNIYLQVSVELGALGIALLLTALFSQFNSLRRAIISSAASRNRVMLVACEAMCWGMLAAGFFVGLLWQKTFWMVLILSALAVRTLSTVEARHRRAAQISF
jgi:O-antigen ligase